MTDTSTDPGSVVPDPFEDDHRRLTAYVGGHDDPPDPADVLAMQMVLRIEKADPPDRTELLVAAARAVALLCLDDRSGGDGPWSAPMDAWCDARIRKIARRARGAQWVAAQEVWGLTATEGGAQARALVPGRVGDVDKRISRLQIGGTEVDGELPPAPGGRGVCLWLDPRLEMTVGKSAAQVGHGAMLAVKLLDEATARDWREAGCPLMVCAADDSTWTRLLAAERAGEAVAVRDAGFTEIAPGSVTVIAEVIE
ncbi:peptidyl-tRNA hydrolase [Gordonia polyisoprenivorans]|uniref:peptidyl-tRNA hydrolase n=1 Tax=Gordonia TaxID=2053 RepID=UPI00037E2779|nr:MULTISPECIES: peptidyl-tRNA hydrolase [Gordonia]MBE7195512.1 peptidyl-tRNA hydrolase [Gordonia polyisoprenivorans]MDF3283686.1 peptidyl-tRNA hydrolase [Gordonia sp. N1V]UZF54517.1 peptidyl-tRNA hydrolase [Gordonia polyisoprenivorans]